MLFYIFNIENSHHLSSFGFVTVHFAILVGPILKPTFSSSKAIPLVPTSSSSSSEQDPSTKISSELFHILQKHQSRSKQTYKTITCFMVCNIQRKCIAFSELSSEPSSQALPVTVVAFFVHGIVWQACTPLEYGRDKKY